MVCGTCGANIADKAIICYRCGTATSTPVPKHPAAVRRRPWAPGAATVVVAAGLAAFGATQSPESAAQIAGLAGAAGALVAGGWLWWRGRR